MTYFIPSVSEKMYFIPRVSENIAEMLAVPGEHIGSDKVEEWKAVLVHPRETPVSLPAAPAMQQRSGFCVGEMLHSPGARNTVQFASQQVWHILNVRNAFCIIN